MVNILFTLPSLSPTDSKLPRVLRICVSLDRRMYRPIVSVDHVGRLDNLGQKLLAEQDVPVYVIRLSPHPRDKLRSWSELLTSASKLRQLNIDIQHSFDYARWWTEPIVARLGGVRHWITTKANSDFRGVHWRIRLALADCIVAQSPTMADELKHRFPHLENRVRIIPNGVDTSLFQPRQKNLELLQSLGAKSDALVLGCVAHLTEIKDHPALLKALALSMHKEIELLLIGRSLRPSYEMELRRLANDLGISTRVHFLGLRTEIPSLHSLMDGIVLASKSESIPNALLEGMSSGLPVIATEVGGIPDLVRNGVNGWLVPRNEQFERELAKAIDEWAANRDKRINFGKISRCIVIENYGISRMVGDHLKLYESISCG